MPAKKLYSASEIADMRLPGLPTTKGRVIQRATSEGWFFEEAKGLGGTRRMYDVPEHYLVHFKPQAAERKEHVIVVEGPKEAEELRKALGPATTTIVSGSKADMELLTLAVQAVEEWCQETGRTLSPGRKSSVIAVLYDYLVKGGGETDVRTLLHAVG